MTTAEATTQTGAEDVAWDLSDVYQGPDDPALERDLDDARTSAAAFHKGYAGRVGDLDAAGLLEAVRELERLRTIIVRAGAFAYMHFSTNTADPARGALLQRIQEEGAALDTELLFFRLEWTALDETAVDEVLEDETLSHYRHFLQALRRWRPYLLTEPEERILSEKSVSGPSAWARLYQELISAMRVALDGREVSFEEAITRLHGPDRDVRKQAADAITDALGPGL